MSKGYWDGQFAPYIISALGLVIIGLLSFAIASERAAYRAQAGYEQQRTYDYARNAETNIERTCGGLDGQAQTICVKEIIESTNEHQRSERNLSAQQNMARWALWMVVLSAVSSVITAIGIYFVWRTLDANTAAVAQAKEANQLFRDEMRPWIDYTVTAEFAYIDVEGLNFIVRFHLTNIGKSPAYGIGPHCIVYSEPLTHTMEGSTAVSRQLHDRRAEEFFKTQSEMDPTNRSLLPGGETSFAMMKAFGRKDWERFYIPGLGEQIRPMVAIHCPYFWQGGSGQTSKRFSLTLLNKGTKKSFVPLDGPALLEIDISTSPAFQDDIR